MVKNGIQEEQKSCPQTAQYKYNKKLLLLNKKTEEEEEEVIAK